LRKGLQEVEAKLQEEQKARLAMFAGNAMIDLARFILKGNPQESEHSTHRLVQLSQTIKDDQLQKLAIPPKYYALLRKLPRVCI